MCTIIIMIDAVVVFYDITSSKNTGIGTQNNKLSNSFCNVALYMPL